MSDGDTQGDKVRYLIGTKCATQPPLLSFPQPPCIQVIRADGSREQVLFQPPTEIGFQFCELQQPITLQFGDTVVAG